MQRQTQNVKELKNIGIFYSAFFLQILRDIKEEYQLFLQTWKWYFFLANG